MENKKRNIKLKKKKNIESLRKEIQFKCYALYTHAGINSYIKKRKEQKKKRKPKYTHTHSLSTNILLSF